MIVRTGPMNTINDTLAPWRYWRLNLYRYDFKDGASKPVELDAWSPTHKPSFHVPEYFGMGTMLPPSGPGGRK